MKDLYVVNCCRTAVGSFGGSLKNTPAADMGAIVVPSSSFAYIGRQSPSSAPTSLPRTWTS